MAKKWKWGTILLLVVLMVSFVGVSWGSQDNPRGAALQRGGVYRVKFNLNLTPEQRQQIARLRLSFQEQTVDLRAQLAKKMIELRKLWLEDIPDQTRIYSLIDEIGGIRTRINKKKVEFILHIREILTPQQLKKFFPAEIGPRKWRHSPRPCW